MDFSYWVFITITAGISAYFTYFIKGFLHEGFHKFFFKKYGVPSKINFDISIKTLLNGKVFSTNFSEGKDEFKGLEKEKQRNIILGGIIADMIFIVIFSILMITWLHGGSIWLQSYSIGCLALFILNLYMNLFLERKGQWSDGWAWRNIKKGNIDKVLKRLEENTNVK